jgi:polyketide cyclase/dehydrase/lipid transport protein
MSTGDVRASARIHASAEAVYGFLAELANHQRLSDHRFRLHQLSADRRSAQIVMRGPFGIRRTARTTVTDLVPYRRVGGTATVGRRTAGQLRWTIVPAAEGGSRVALTATVVRLGTVDRMLYRLGGRRWLARGFESVIVLLATALESP